MAEAGAARRQQAGRILCREALDGTDETGDRESAAGKRGDPSYCSFAGRACHSGRAGQPGRRAFGEPQRRAFGSAAG